MGSEHLVDGQRKDVELQIIHEGVGAAATSVFSILFSVKDDTSKSTKAEQNVINTFFETLQLDKDTDQEATLLTFGALMEVVDLKNRWAYLGSRTVPPCGHGVYWNILQNVYHIEAKHLNNLKAQLKRSDDPDLFKKFGNYREAQVITTQIPICIHSFDKEVLTDEQSYTSKVDVYNQN